MFLEITFHKDLTEKIQWNVRRLEHKSQQG